MKILPNKITFKLEGDAEITVKDFIALFEYFKYGYHEEWNELTNLRVAEQENGIPDRFFKRFFHQIYRLVTCKCLLSMNFHQRTL